MRFLSGARTRDECRTCYSASHARSKNLVSPTYNTEAEGEEEGHAHAQPTAHVPAVDGNPLQRTAISAACTRQTNILSLTGRGLTAYSSATREHACTGVPHTGTGALLAPSFRARPCTRGCGRRRCQPPPSHPKVGLGQEILSRYRRELTTTTLCIYS